MEPGDKDVGFDPTGERQYKIDFKKNTFGIYTPNKLPKCSVNIYNDGFTDYDVVGKEFNGNPVDKNYPVLLGNGKMIAKSLFILVEDTRLARKMETDFTSKMDISIQFDNSVFIKSKSLNKLLPIESIVYHFTIETLKER